MRSVEMKKRIGMSMVVVASTWLCSMPVFGGMVTSAGVSFARFQFESGIQEYALFADVFGTVSEFKSIVLTSPLSQTFDLSLAEEGDQWGLDLGGTQAEIEPIVPDGTYVFDVVFTDDSTQTVNVQLAGVLPEFPTGVSLDGNTVTWDAWVSPMSPFVIEVELEQIEGDGSFFVGLSHTETSFELPDGTLEAGAAYELSVLFISSASTGGFKNSTSVIVIPEPHTN